MQRILFITLLALAACTQPQSGDKLVTSKAAMAPPAPPGTPTTPAFNAYWYQGQAEISVYDVEQERYGQMRPAQQVNVFVTEDVSAAKQVKLDDPASAGSDKVPVLKLNAIRRFHTGIYDYSLMQSVFTPVDGAPTVKISSTMQDWCGHVFTQFNQSGKGYKVREFSYFEQESDTEAALEAVIPEDELWTRLRIDPAQVPVGEQYLTPSPWYARLRHKGFAREKANIALTDAPNGERLLSIQYTGIPRSLTLRFEAKSPYRIMGWEEKEGEKTLSKGQLRLSRKEAYWSQNSRSYDALRDSLQLDF
jgi:hypothetical protein